MANLPSQPELFGGGAAVTRGRRKQQQQEFATKIEVAKATRTVDSFQNYQLNLGIGTNNALSGSTYGFNPITRIQTLLEWIYRGSWLGGIAVDLIADDMTRAGVEVRSNLAPDQIDKLHRRSLTLGVWSGINSTIKWGRLYGGAIGVLLIDGQDLATPLDWRAVQKDQFKGVFALPRWCIEPSVNNLVQDMGPFMGLPSYYKVLFNAPALQNKVVHYSRVLRYCGIDLPWQQQISENMWGVSVLERLYDRMIAFDSATQGAAQLIYKSALRTMKVKGMRQIVAEAQDAAAALVKYTDMVRYFQGIEGMTLIDADDDIEALQINVQAGISDALMQFGQQISGALQIPLVRLFGQSPAGMSATGESDLRTYYDGIANQQERELRETVLTIYRVMALSMGLKVDDEFNIMFNPLWQMTDVQKAEIAEKDGRNIAEMEGAGIVDRVTALRELKERGRNLGRWTNITDETIAHAESDAPLEREADKLLKEAQVEAARAAAENGGVPPGDGDKDDGEQPGGGQKKPARPTTNDQGGLPLVDFQGLPILIETERGDIRRGRGWAVKMPADYGYIRRTGSAEGADEGMDVFIGDDKSAPYAFVVDVYDPITGKFDEHKVMLGFPTEESARVCFNLAYHDARECRDVTRMEIRGLERWIKTGDVTRPLADQTRLRIAT